MKMATQLRRYEIAEGRLDDFLKAFPAMIPVRNQYGFSVDFAYGDHENSQFVWSTSHDGDQAAFEAAEAVLKDAPERAEALKGLAGMVEKLHVTMVESIL
jgi:hypothetical protein